MPDITQILSRIESGDNSATEELLPLLYEEFEVPVVGRLTCCLRTYAAGNSCARRTPLAEAVSPVGHYGICHVIQFAGERHLCHRQGKSLRLFDSRFWRHG